LLFALLAYRGLRIALRTPDNFGMLLALGITTMFILQALLNMAVIVATSPPTGVTLPFVSYGGRSLVAALAGVGILLSISRYGARAARPADAGKYSYERVDLGRRDRGTRVSGAGRAPAARSGSYQSTAPRPPSTGDGRVRGTGGSGDSGARRRQD
jgi:cell division protein FtsW